MRTGNNLTAVQILEAAKVLITPPDRWTQCATARAANGRPVSPRSYRAYAFCASGALARVGGDTPERWKASEYLWLAAAERGAENPMRVNDGGDPLTAHATTLAMFDDATTMARAEEG